MKRFLAWAAAMLLLWPAATAETPEDLIDQIMREQVIQCGGENLQDWVDTALTESAGGSGGWYLIALRHLERMEENSSGTQGRPRAGLDFRKARKALEQKAAEKPGSITQRERMALTLQALGSQDSLIQETADQASKENTLMPLIFALHLLNNSTETEQNSRLEAAKRIQALQLQDGGWAVIGEKCDVDCTAMALQALAPLHDDPETGKSIEKGVQALSRIQQENGGYLGMGKESAESCAQVLLALSCLHIDARKDTRFLKNGNSVLDAMLRFRLEGDGFAHDLKSRKRNDTATVQCFYALVGYARMLQGGGPYYQFDFRPLQEGQAASEGPPAVRTWLYLAAAVLTAGCWILAAARGKRNWRSYAFPALAGAILAILITGIDIQSSEGYYRGAASSHGERTMETTISIRCDSIAGESPYAPENGEILAEDRVLLAEGETAFDQLAEATRIHRIQMEYDGTTAGAYVRGISYLYEYEFGNLSGWMYKVNGVFADTGCSQYRLAAGDRVEWIYTKNLGKDE